MTIVWTHETMCPMECITAIVVVAAAAAGGRRTGVVADGEAAVAGADGREDGAVVGGDGGVALLAAREADEAVAARGAGRAVRDDLGLDDGAAARKELRERVARHAGVEVADVEVRVLRARRPRAAHAQRLAVDLHAVQRRDRAGRARGRRVAHKAVALAPVRPPVLHQLHVLHRPVRLKQRPQVPLADPLRKIVHYQVASFFCRFCCSCRSRLGSLLCRWCRFSRHNWFCLL